MCPKILSGQVKALQPGDFNIDEAQVDYVGIKDTIVQTIMGSEFRQMIDSKTGKWGHPEFTII